MKVQFNLNISTLVTIDLPAKQARKLIQFVDDRGVRCDAMNAEEWPEGVTFPWPEIENQIGDHEIEIEQVEIVPPKPKKAKAKR